MRLRSERQLFRALDNVNLPDGTCRVSGQQGTNWQVLASTAFVRWPNGKPCTPVNMYLVDNAYKWTGRTAVMYASELTELLRYCSRTRKRFSELNDDDILALARWLMTEKSPGDLSTRRRNDTRVRILLKRYLAFLAWYQENLYFGLRPIVGERRDSAMITCEKRVNSRCGETYWTHRHMPTRVSADPKVPIALNVIEDIEASVEHLADLSNLPAAALRPFQADPETLRRQIGYLYERRIFMIWLLKRTGLRPGEMIALSLAANTDPFKTHALVIPTLKRRKTHPPNRKFALMPKDEAAVFRYVTARKEWFEHASSSDAGLGQSDVMFLSVAPGRLGQPISKSGIEKDFRRLCIHAGYRDRESCLSMFRHRYITCEVLAHLKVWEVRKGAVTTVEDYRSILERVRVKTGHASVESLWHYIDLARGMEGIWSEADRFANRVHAADHFMAELRTLRRDIQLTGDDSDILDSVVSRLSSIIGAAKESS